MTDVIISDPVVPDGAVAISLSHGGFALVSECDAERVRAYRWYKTTFGYAVSGLSGTRESRNTLWMHRFVLDAADGLDVDHINHDRLDNRRENLRQCTRAQNLANGRRHRDSTSPYKGVTWRKDISRWTARIMVRGKVHHLGCFDTAEQAHAAYVEAGRALVGEYLCPS